MRWKRGNKKDMYDHPAVLLPGKDPPVPVMQKSFGMLKSSIKSHKWIWIGGAVVVVAAAAVATLWLSGVFGPSGRAVCKISVERARDYGTLPPGAQPEGSTKSTDVSGRKSCIAKADGDTYTVTVDIKCKDLKNADCLPIYSVERDDGMSFYQVRQIPNDGDDGEASGTADAGPSPEENGAATAPDGSMVIDTDVAPDNE